MRDTSARMLALLGLLQSRADWSGAELADRLERHRPHRAQRRRAPARPRLPRRRAPRSRRPLPARRRRQAAAAAAGRGRSRSRRGRPARRHRDGRLRGERRPGAHQAGAGAARPAASPADGAARGDERRPGEHRLQRRGPGRRAGAAERAGRRDPRPPGAALRLPRRAVARSSPTTWSPGSGAGTWSAATPRPATWAPYRVDWLRLRTPGGRRFAPAARSRAT